MSDKNKLILVRLLIIGIVTVFFLMQTAAASPLLSNSGGGSWQYYKEITVNENSGSALTDYQVLVQLSSSNFPTNALSDGADIRFTDSNGNELSYWIESWDYSGNNGRLWVKVPSLSAGTIATINMYYGNPSASKSSNGASTFEFFDDFNENSLNTNKWTTSNFGMQPIKSVVISDSVLSFTGNGCGGSCSDGVSLRMNRNFYYNEKVAVETKFKFTGNSWGSGAGLWVENSFSPVNLPSSCYHSSCTWILCISQSW